MPRLWIRQGSNLERLFRIKQWFYTIVLRDRVELSSRGYRPHALTTELTEDTMDRRESFIGYIKKYFEEHGNAPSRKLYNSSSDTSCSSSTASRIFGSWNNAIAACGITPRKTPSTTHERPCLRCGRITKNSALNESSHRKQFKTSKKNQKKRFCIRCGIMFQDRRTKQCTICTKNTCIKIEELTKGQVAHGKQNGANKYSRINEHARTVIKKTETRMQKLRIQ